MTAPPAPALWDEGFRLRGSALRFDARRASDFSIVSDASRALRHARMLCTDRTARLLRARPEASATLPSPFGRSVSVGPLRLELFPSGHVLGAAQVLVELGELRLVYCGGFSPYGSLTAESHQVRPCDVLLLDCPYDAPEIVFPPPGETRAAILEWVQDAIAAGATPVLLAGALGNGQELLKLLGDRGIPVRAHRAIYDAGKVYRELGVPLANARPFRGTPLPGEAVLFPLHLAAAPAIRKIRRACFALVSGRALLAAEVARARVDASFALSRHSDHPGLVAMVRATGARHVVLSPRHGAAFEKVLRKKGIRTTRHAIPEQLRLPV